MAPDAAGNPIRDSVAYLLEQWVFGDIMQQRVAIDRGGRG
jgi:hypothetical protein